VAKDPEPYRTRPGQDVIFSANLSAGTDVSYSWWLGSGMVHLQAGRWFCQHASFPSYQLSSLELNHVGKSEFCRLLKTDLYRRCWAGGASE